jgi:hypothetical protein
MKTNKLFTSLFKTTILLIVAFMNVECSHHKVRITKDDVTLNNPCASDALSNFLEDIQYGGSLLGFTSSKNVLDICPNLKFSCCRFDQINSMVDQLNISLGYLNYRGEMIERMFNRVSQIADETFKVFLSELSEGDIKCYNSIQNEMIDQKLTRFTDQPNIMEMIQQRRKHVQYDPRKLMSSFSYLKKMITPYIAKMNETYMNREKFFSGFVCSMCSPMFYKQFKVEKPGIPFMEVNEHMCSQIIRDKIDFINSLEIFPFLQKLIDIVYCARTNSKTNKNYGKFERKDLNLMVFDLEVFPEYKNKRMDCIQNKNAYFKDLDKPENCKSICQKGLGLFELNMVSIDKFIRIENEFHNMFFRVPGMKQTTNQRLESITDDYYQERDLIIQTGMLSFDEKTQVEKIWYLKYVQNPKLDFTKTEIEVNQYVGLHVNNTPMDQRYYKNVSIFYTLILSVFVIIAF